MSISRYVSPPKLKVSSTVSRVVPAIALTIALSSPRSAFNKVDLPAFGAPSMAVAIPFLMAFPYLKLSMSALTFWRRPWSIFSNWSRDANSTSSSLKSNSNSIIDAKCTKSSRKSVISFERPPFNWRKATSCIVLFSAWMRSATASAWAKSILPFIKARIVYSPGSARRAPACNKLSMIRPIM